MNTNENMRNDTSEDVIVLGTASVETQGGGVILTEPYGDFPGAGIADE